MATPHRPAAARYWLNLAARAAARLLLVGEIGTTPPAAAGWPLASLSSPGPPLARSLLLRSRLASAAASRGPLPSNVALGQPRRAGAARARGQARVVDSDWAAAAAL